MYYVVREAGKYYIVKREHCPDGLRKDEFLTTISHSDDMSFPLGIVNSDVGVYLLQNLI